MKKHASNLREVSYREAAPFPPQPPRRLTNEQRSELNTMRIVCGVVVALGTIVSMAASFAQSWAEVWPSHWHTVVLLGAVLVVPSILLAWATWRLWRDESLGGGER